MGVILLFFRDGGFDIADCIYSVEELYGKEFSVAKDWCSTVVLGAINTSQPLNSERRRAPP